MNGRKTSELCKVDAVTKPDQSQPSAQPSHSDRVRTVDLCQNGVCAITWKPCKPAAA